MTRIPTHDSNLSLQPTPMDPRVASQVGQEIVDVSEGLSSLGQKLQEHQDWRETKDAEIYMARHHNENISLAHSDPDIDTLEMRLENKSNQDVQSAANLIKSQQARNSFIEKATLKQEIQKSNLFSVINSRKIQDGKGKLLQANDEIIKEYQNTSDPEQRSLLKQQLIDDTNEAKAKGYINGSWAEHYIQTHIKAMDIGQVAKDIDAEPNGALKELEKGNGGIYKDLNDKERASFIKQAKNVIERKNTIAKRVAIERRNNNEADLAMKQLNGIDISSDIEEGLFNKTVSRSFFDKAVANGASPVGPTAETDKNVYVGLIHKLIDPSTTPEIARAEILQANTDGKISPQDARRLYQMHLTPDGDAFKSIADSENVDADMAFLDRQEKLKSNLNKKKEKFSGVRDFFRGWGIGRKKEDVADAWKSFYDKTGDTKPDGYMGVAQGVINEKNIQDNPTLFNQCPQDGSVCLDGQGRKALVFPNGVVVRIH